MAKKFLLGVVLVLVSFPAIFAQKPDVEAEKLKAERRAKLIEQIRGDAEQLKLPENRAFMLAKTGSIVWKTDEEYGRKLFRSAITELIAAQQIAEANKNPNHQFHDLLNSQNLRPQILNAIASVDAEFALESLYKSRPALVERALAGGAANGKINSPSMNQSYVAQNEVNLEQRFVRMTIEQKPEKSLALLKDSIRKKLSGETLQLLNKLYEKEPVEASDLARDVVSRLNSRSFFTEQQANHDLISLSTTIIAEFMQERGPDERRLTFEESGVRSLATRVINTYLTRGQQMGYIPLEQLEPFVKRFSPASYEPLKKIAQTTRYRGHGLVQNDSEYRKLMEGNPTAETLVSAAKNFPAETQRQIFQTAANKFSENGQYQNAVALLNDRFEGESLESAVSSLNWYYAHHLIQKGEFDAAEAMMLEFNESNRNSALISLAQTIYGRNPEENRSRAGAVLNRVRGFLPDRPETNNEMSQLFQLINVMAAIEPIEAFRNIEPLVDQLNSLTEAMAIVNAFQGGNLRQGEYLLSNGLHFGVYIDPNMIRTLAQKDFDRTTSIVDGFTRREIRILLRLSLAESGF